jgi:hypothetical protein
MSRTIVGSFDRLTEARLVVDALREAGIAPGDIRLMASGGERRQPAAGTDRAGSMADARPETADTDVGSSPGPGGAHAEATSATPHRSYSTADTGQAATDGGGLVGVRTDIDDTPGAVEATGVVPAGALVAARVDEPRIAAVTRIMQRHGAIDVNQRADTWRSSGWEGFDESAQPYTVQDLEREAGAPDLTGTADAPGSTMRGDRS